jgi:hypothetical protein
VAERRAPQNTQVHNADSEYQILGVPRRGESVNAIVAGGREARPLLSQAVTEG